MKGKQENTLTMFDTIIAVLALNLPLITAIPALLAKFNLFKTLTEEINDIVLAQILQIEGRTEDKNAAKEKLALHANVVAEVVKSFAMDTNNDVLKVEVDYSETDLIRLRDIMIQQVAQIIYTRANTNIVALADYGITTQIMDDLLDAITKYQSKLPTPTVARDMREVATTELKEKIKEANDLLRFNMDSGMGVFKLTNLHFYRLYKNARSIIDLHGSATDTTGVVKGVVKDVATGLIITGAVIEVIDNLDVVSSDVLGEFELNLEPGTYSIRVNKDGYSEFEQSDIVVVKGEEVVVNVMLEAMV
ncbi:MAG TPA: carboxypeptidase-like regulatory domain-containing protein [Chitinophagales bacterium]|nr:carboxypeptidase-like regulatory domain-containing protein [Chitinophagales bacterium]